MTRALYKESSVLILDEPTAALDTAAEYEIYKDFNRLIKGRMEDRIIIMISHRLSNTRMCDKVAVFHNGAITQYGSLHELLTNSGSKYAQIWEAQYYSRL